MKSTIITIFAKNQEYAYTVHSFGLRFCFYTEDHEPVHVHVIAHGIEAKFNIDPEVTLVYNKGLTIREVKLAKQIIEENEEVIRKRWKEVFYQNRK